jgi:hypothetical protein
MPGSYAITRWPPNLTAFRYTSKQFHNKNSFLTNPTGDAGSAALHYAQPRSIRKLESYIAYLESVKEMNQLSRRIAAASPVTIGWLAA